MSESTDPKTKRAKSEIEELVLEDTSPLNQTLDQILHLQTKGVASRSALHGFLEKRGAGELIEFWVAVLNFCKLTLYCGVYIWLTYANVDNAYEPENATSSFSYYGVRLPDDSVEEPSKKMEEINKIYSMYLADNAERKVALAPEILEDILKKVFISLGDHYHMW